MNQRFKSGPKKAQKHKSEQNRKKQNKSIKAKKFKLLKSHPQDNWKWKWRKIYFRMKAFSTFFSKSRLCEGKITLF